MPRPPSSLPRSAVEYAERALPASLGSAEALPESAIHALQDVQADLRTVFGPAGCEAIFRRGVSRAAARHPLLGTAEAERTPEGFVGALCQHVRPDNVEEIGNAVRDVIAEQIALLTRFIGEDLVRTILHAEREQRSELRAEAEARDDG